MEIKTDRSEYEAYCQLQRSLAQLGAKPEQAKPEVTEDEYRKLIEKGLELVQNETRC